MYLQTHTQLLKDHLDRLVWCNTVAICMYRYGLLVDLSMLTVVCLQVFFVLFLNEINLIESDSQNIY